VTSDTRHDIDALAPLGADRDDRLGRRLVDSYASDPQFRTAEPIRAVIDAARRPALRLAPNLQTLVGGHADRPELGQRARELVTDPATWELINKYVTDLQHLDLLYPIIGT
jgi:hypothetical protein